jgi:serine/threonine protein phosphatase PrpC
MSINPSFKDVRNLEELNQFLESPTLAPTVQKNGSVKVIVGNQVLTRNQINLKFHECLKKEGINANQETIRSLAKKLDKLEKALPAEERTKISGMRQKIGNLFFKLMYGFERKAELNKIDERFKFREVRNDYGERNENKAVMGHKGKDAAYIQSLSELKVSSAHHKELKFEHQVEESIGIENGRPTMEDAHCFKIIKQGIITGVFDGHGGADVSKYANEQFEKRFEEVLEKSNGNVRSAFETLIKDIQKECLDKKFNGGSTAVMCFVDKKTNLVYTATLGDSEANIYRKNKEEELKSVPLSVVKDFSDPKERARAQMSKHGLYEPNTDDPKHKRIGDQWFGVNTPRAFGDRGFLGSEERPGIIQKPKITVMQLEPGDTLILACDGLKDFVKEGDIVGIVNEGYEGLSQRLVKASIAEQRPGKRDNDNVTVIAIKIT